MRVIDKTVTGECELQSDAFTSRLGGCHTCYYLADERSDRILILSIAATVCRSKYVYFERYRRQTARQAHAVKLHIVGQNGHCEVSRHMTRIKNEVLKNPHHHHGGDRLSAAVGMTFIWLTAIQPVFAIEVDGFTQPYRTVNVAAPDAGIIDAISARVGNVVTKGQILVQLDTEVHSLLVESARARMDARGGLVSARAELNLRTYRLEKLKEVLQRGHGRQEEVERAQADVDIAAAQTLDAEDDLLFKKLDYRRLKVELERRTIRAPLSGVVSQNLKEEGEYVVPNDPDLLTLVQLDPLLAKFSLRRSHAAGLELGQTVTVSFPYDTDTVEGVIDEMSPIIDAESGTLRVKVRLENPHGRYDSGQRCSLHLSDPDFKSVTSGGRVKPGNRKPARQFVKTRDRLPLTSTTREGR